jgi:DNA replication protein DnaC
MDDLTIASSDTIDRHWLETNAERGRESWKRIPAHYENAEITNADIRSWVGRLLRDVVVGTRAGNPVLKRGRSLLILGPVGTGKTFEAFGVVRALTTSGAGVSWQFVTAADLYATLRPRAGSDSETAFRTFADCRLLVVDDLGAAKSSEWVEEINYRLVNHRYENELPTIITSNLQAKDLGPGLGDRVTSRLAEMTTRVVLTGVDRRRAA